MELPESTLNVAIGTKIFLTLEKAAVRQIDAAIDALEAGLFDVALTLAGAAEGMIDRAGLHMVTSFLGCHSNASGKAFQAMYASMTSAKII